MVRRSATTPRSSSVTTAGILASSASSPRGSCARTIGLHSSSGSTNTVGAKAADAASRVFHSSRR
jgi:hypothetical protein